MNDRLFGLIILLIVNLFVTVIYVVWNYIRRRELRLSIWMKAWMMLLCPVIGAAFLFLAYVFYKAFMSQAMDLDDVIFCKEKTNNIMKADEERERNITSLQESLLITEKHELRKLMMNIIKGEYRNSLSSISMALNSEDSETAHYAASVLQEVLNTFRSEVQEQYRVCQQEEREDQLKRCIELLEYMNPVLTQKIFTEIEQISMALRMDEICELVWKKSPEKIQSRIYEMVSMRLLECKQYEICRKWCLRAVQQYPKSLASYTCQLKLYYTCKERDAFFQVMEELKRSEIMLDHETLELIRVFM